MEGEQLELFPAHQAWEYIYTPEEEALLLLQQEEERMGLCVKK